MEQMVSIILRVLWIAFVLVGGLAFLWLVVLKLMARLAARMGRSSPCPASLSWLVHNPIRRRYMRPIIERTGICPGERVLELGPGPGASRWRLRSAPGRKGVSLSWISNRP